MLLTELKQEVDHINACVEAFFAGLNMERYLCESAGFSSIFYVKTKIIAGTEELQRQIQDHEGLVYELVGAVVDSQLERLKVLNDVLAASYRTIKYARAQQPSDAHLKSSNFLFDELLSDAQIDKELHSIEAHELQHRMAKDIYYWVNLDKSFTDVPVEITSNGEECQTPNTCKPLYATYHEKTLYQAPAIGNFGTTRGELAVYHYQLFNTSSQIIKVHSLVIHHDFHCPINLKLLPGGSVFVAAAKRMRDDDADSSFFRVSSP